MAGFMIRFLICNVFISAVVGILLIAKQFFKNSLSGRMQYNLWFLLLGLLTVPFMPFRPVGFAPENIQAVKDAICLASSADGAMYGKTGTGRVDGQDINGWFIGYTEAADHTCFFATNIEADGNATGSIAAEITLSILSDMNNWK